MRCSKFVNISRMKVRLSGEQLEAVDYFKNLGSQLTVHGDVGHSMNGGYRACGELISVLSNRGFGIRAKKNVCMKE